MAEGGLSIGTLSGRIELDDHFTATITLSDAALDQLEKRFGGVDATVRKTAEGMIGAEVAIRAIEEVAHLAAEGLKMISTEGAGIADVEENFNKLTLGAGELGDELLGSLKEGTHNTITDFELMKSVNNNLAAGVSFTSQQYKDLSTGAFALAQAKGQDVASAFEKINDAMLTGKVKQVQYLTGKIDLADAEDRYAKSLGTTAERLTAEEKSEAARVIIMEKVRDATARLGEQSDGLDEKVAQVATSWKNFEEDLGKTIASSPVIIASFDRVKEVLSDAFGSDREEMIQNITQAVETLATGAVHVIEVGVDIVKFMVVWRAVLEPIVVGIGAYYAGTLLATAGTEAMAIAIKGVALAGSTMGGIAIAATAIYAAFELGKWKPVSDFFEKLALKTFYGMSSAEAEAAVATHHLTDEAVAAAHGVGELKTAEEEINLATMDWHKELDTIDGSLVDWAEHLLATGVSAKAVATEFGFTDAQVKALQMDVAEHNKTLAEATKRSEELAAGVRLSKQEMKDFATVWENLTSAGNTYKEVLDTINPKIVDSVKYYASLGTTVEELTKAFPGLTKSQAEAAVEGTKSAQEIQKVWTEVFALQSKMHGDNITDYIKLETRKYNESIDLLTRQGKATSEMLDAEKAKFITTIDAEIQKREEGIDTSRAFYQKEADDAKAKLDLMLTHRQDFIDQDMRLAEHDYTEKRRLLERWAQDASDKIDKQTAQTKSASEQQGKSIDQLASHWNGVSMEIEVAIQKVTLMSGRVVMLSDIMKGFVTGHFDASGKEINSITMDRYSSQQFASAAASVGQGLTADTLRQMVTAGYGSLEDITRLASDAFREATALTMTHGHPQAGDAINRWKAIGGQVPGFEKGGVGDFGEGTLAILHGREAILPLDNEGSGLGNIYITNHINGTATDVARKVSEEIMRTLKSQRKFGSA